MERSALHSTPNMSDLDQHRKDLCGQVPTFREEQLGDMLETLPPVVQGRLRTYSMCQPYGSQDRTEAPHRAVCKHQSQASVPGASAEVSEMSECKRNGTSTYDKR